MEFPRQPEPVSIRIESRSEIDRDTMASRVDALLSRLPGIVERRIVSGVKFLTFYPNAVND